MGNAGRLSAFFIFTVLLLSFIQLNGFSFSSQEIVLGPYTQNVTDNSITVVWETSAATTNNSVEYWENESHLFVKYSPSGYHHEVVITPTFSRGYYRVASDGVKSRAFEFELASNCYNRGYFKTVIFGDSRGTWDNWVHAKEASDAVNREHPDIVIHGGDMVGNGSSIEQWNRWLDISMPLLQNSTMFAVLGNHEHNNSRYYEIFSLPNNERWYSFDYGPCHFIVLDNYGAWGAGSPQYRWLEDDLSSTDKPFKIVCFHEPIYCSGGHSSRADIRAAWAPLFKKYGVNVVFQSHNHYYQRTEPINGITYIVTGGAGAPLYDPEDAWFMEKSMKAFHYCVLNVSLQDMEIRCTAKYTNGTSFDKFTLVHEMPGVEISKPESALYLFNKEIMPLPSPVIIGRIDIEAAPAQNFDIKNAEFYIDGEMKYSDSEEPYAWLWDERALGSHEIMVKAYDSKGAGASDKMQVMIFHL